MKRRNAVILSLILTAVAVLSTGCSGEKYYSQSKTVFSSSIVFSAQIMHADGKGVYEQMYSAVQEIGQTVNAVDENSALYKFNQSSATDWTEVNEHFYNLASTAKSVYEKTDGAFNCAVLDATKLWGVDSVGIANYGYGQGQPTALPSPSELTALKQSASMDNLSVKTESGKYYIRKTIPDLKLDFGGLAKGYCADLCAEIARNRGVKSALIDISGNIVLVGDYYENGNPKKWGVGVINPRKTASNSRYVCGFKTNGGVSIVTAGDYERYYSFDYGDGEKLRVCHIIDGQTLIPISLKTGGQGYEENAQAVCSATVVGESSMLCDAYATAIAVMGVERGKQFLTDEGLSGLIFTADKKRAVVGQFDFVSSQTLYLTEYQSV